MSKELEALEKLMNACCDTCYHEICETKRNSACRDFKNYKIIESALKEKEQQDNIINIIKETIEFNIQEPKIKIKENGKISLLSRVGMSLRRYLNEKERELFREWIIKTCFPEELKALDIIKEYKFLSVFKDINGKCFIIFTGKSGSDEIATAVEIQQDKYNLLEKVLL